MNKFTMDNVVEIVKKNNWSFTTCTNEKSGEECEGWVTIQIGVDEGDYFGEFVGMGGSNQYEFIMYRP